MWFHYEYGNHQLMPFLLAMDRLREPSGRESVVDSRSCCDTDLKLQGFSALFSFGYYS